MGAEARVGRVPGVRLHQGRIDTQTAGAQHPSLDREREQPGIELLKQLRARAPGELHQRGWVWHTPDEADAAEAPPGERVGHLLAQRLVPDPIAVLEVHEPQIGLDRDRRATDRRGETAAEGSEEALLVKDRVPPSQARAATRAAPPATPTPRSSPPALAPAASDPPNRRLSRDGRTPVGRIDQARSHPLFPGEVATQQSRVAPRPRPPWLPRRPAALGASRRSTRR
jgi:hypothetical protein